jgi:hypothetical protein
MNIAKIRNVKTPNRGTKGSAGIDFFIPFDFTPTKLLPNESILIPSGIKCDIPDNYIKMWLTGTKAMIRLNYIMKMEQKYLNIPLTKKMEQSVIKYYTQTYEEYDEFLSQNIVFIDLFDAAANNTVLECIVRKTPLIVNRLPGVMDYLGENYPLYFSNLDEVSSLLQEEKLLEAHEYLKTIDTKPLEIDYFIRKLLTHIHDIF